ncbi:hypothetical protein JQN72_03145 [Phycicoccus sp. CSK15P-2]|uniref:YciI family protein n=1 Tax=Phycicoccus sp. CSK15P-2 TaxID=2807627 RepID=UPI00194E81A9|nr:YciI family protein [Phycicoccus sp. CSK15P-2]MBM6403242.1 hypothetical protein [Phycicoccus sp. CSK15P-2]
MAQYMLGVYHAAGVHEAGEVYADEAAMEAAIAAVDEFNETLQASGAWLFAGGLTPPESATVVDNTGSDVTTTDGPFAESKEFLGGFWVIEASDLDAAIEIAAKGSAACGQRVEVRPLASE